MTPDDPLAELLARIERATFGTSIGQTTLDRWAVGLREHRTELLEALGGEPADEWLKRVWVFPEGGV